MVRVTQVVPDYEFDAYVEGAISKRKLSDFRGKWLVLLFYPADFTFVCPTELAEAADRYAEFVKLGAEVVSVSTDTAYCHKAWHDSSPSIAKIEYPMAADPTGKLCKEFGTYLDGEGLSLRGTFIIDPQGVLKSADIHDNAIGRSAEEIIRKLEAAVFVSTHKGLVCPASWRPGKDALETRDELVGKI